MPHINPNDAWVELYDGDHPYYWNECTGMKQWEKPIRFCNKVGNWVAELDINGEVYYSNIQTGAISIKRPINYGKPPPPGK